MMACVQRALKRRRRIVAEMFDSVVRSRMSKFAIAAIVLVGLAASVPAAEPRLETRVVFQAGQGGYESYRIPCLVATAKGTLLAFCEARGAKGDWGAIDLVMRRSSDSGATWSARARSPTSRGRIEKTP